MKISIKNNIWIKNKVCSAGSKILKNFIPTKNAFVVDCLLDSGFEISSADLEEFATGTLGKNTLKRLAHPITNAVLGGSSVGGAYNLLINKNDIASIGTDTGGSVRVPAVFNNLVGFKPSYGVISRYGVIDLSNDLDCVGILAKRIKDVKPIFDVINKKDGRDLTQINFKLDPEQIMLKTDIFYFNNGQNILGHVLVNEGIKKIIMREYTRRSNTLFYSNLLRFDGRRFNETVEGFKNKDLVTEKREKLLLKSSINRFKDGAQRIFEKESPDWIDFLSKILVLKQKTIVFNCKDLKPKAYHEKYTKNEIRDIDWKFVLANLLGRPSIVANGLLIIAPLYKDYSLLNEINIDYIEKSYDRY